MSRPTRDIDLLGRVENSLERLAGIAQEACEVRVEDDGMEFDVGSVTATRITEDADYEGVRLRLQGALGKAKVFIQVDVGFGDVLGPGVRRITYPALLDFPSAELDGYLPEETIAEKYQAMVKLGAINSRMKDFYDIWFLSRTFEFSGEALCGAVAATFDRRSTSFAGAAALFEAPFMTDESRSRQWSAFIGKTDLSDAPVRFQDVMLSIGEFLRPVTSAVADGKTLEGSWRPPGPWR